MRRNFRQVFSNWMSGNPWLLAVLACTIAQTGMAQTVTVREGNIYLITPSGQQWALTSSGRDSDPALSDDRSKVVFVRTIRDRPDASGLGRVVDQSEIDSIDLTSPNREVHVLLNSPVHARGLLFQWFSSPRFSPDGQHVFFMIPDYATISPGLFSLNMVTSIVQFLTGALKYWTLSSGSYKGDLIVWQNPTLVGGGRYNVFNLITSSAEPVGVVGFDEASVNAFIASQDY
jgi:Tol biopolymer transport system component